ncbi:hypothetical protein ACH4OY_17785 [Micromonospora rubida]|uniref:Uncharacterized protein n=1 Tax=Micromonospora rubida TaxID=2697657 RepID=A0ABW7SNM3_9ACTN
MHLRNKRKEQGHRGFDPATGNQVTLTVPATPARHVRIRFTGNTGWPAAQLSQLKVHAG